MPRRGVPVQGRCPQGHTLETTSAPGRVTWRGPCPMDGCAESIIARRVPTGNRGKGGKGQGAPDPSKAGKPTSARKVTGYADDPTGPGDAGGGSGGASAGLPPAPGGGPAGPDDSDGDGTGGRPDDPATGPDGEGSRKRGRGRRRWGLRRGSHEDDWIIPDVYP